ncbi:hypothetical protein CV697_05940 [Borreliella burgdorferi]|nr:hypothetical protein CV697_05940 [Borreliella burgdorferi]
MLKYYLGKFLSTKTTVLEMMQQLLLDYQNNINNIQTDENALKSHTEDICNQVSEKRKEAEKLKNDIYSIYRPLNCILKLL